MIATFCRFQKKPIQPNHGHPNYRCILDWQNSGNFIIDPCQEKTWLTKLLEE